MNYRLTELKVLLFLLLLSAVSCQRPMYDEEDDEDGVFFIVHRALARNSRQQQ